MTDNLQLVLINVLIRTIFEHYKVLQDNVVTCIRCDGFVTQSLLSLTVKELLKSVNICQSYGQETNVLYFD